PSVHEWARITAAARISRTALRELSRPDRAEPRVVDITSTITKRSRPVMSGRRRPAPETSAERVEGGELRGRAAGDHGPGEGLTGGRAEGHAPHPVAARHGDVR